MCFPWLGDQTLQALLFQLVNLSCASGVLKGLNTVSIDSQPPAFRDTSERGSSGNDASLLQPHRKRLTDSRREQSLIDGCTSPFSTIFSVMMFDDISGIFFNLEHPFIVTHSRDAKFI